MLSDEPSYYGKIVFENSPLNGLLENFAPGDNWVGSASKSKESTRRGIKMKYWINTTADSVHVWKVSDVVNSLGTYSTSGIYPAGELFKNVLIDENNKQIIEFKDKQGKVILKKLQITADTD